MTSSAVVEHLRRFRMDVARWISPSDVAELAEVTVPVSLKMLYRHLPLRAVGWFRLACCVKDLGVPVVPGYLQRRVLRLYGLDMVPGKPVGGGLYIAHPSGCTLVAQEMGENTTVIAAVTIGMRNDLTWPRLGSRVFLGAGARVLGDICLGDDAKVGANAVVLHDVAPGATVVGIPARAIGG